MSNTKRANKTQKIGEAIADALKAKFSNKANKGNFWFNSKDKETGEYSKNRPVTIENIDKYWTDDHYFNLWHQIADKETGEELEQSVLDEQLEKLVDLFYGSEYTLGLKYPYTSAKGTSVSYSIFKYDK